MKDPQIEYAARTAFHEERGANLIPAHIREERDLINEEIRVADDEQFQRAVEVSLRAGLPAPERRG
jgi:hypothetical protein